MVGELQHGGAERCCVLDQACLAGRLEIPGEQHRGPARRDAHHQRSIVAREALAPPRGPERLDAEIAEPERGLARRTLDQGTPVRSGRVPQCAECRVHASARRKPDARDRKRPEHRDEPPAMVQIGVARHHQVEATHAQRGERRQHHALTRIEVDGSRAYRTARIDQDGRLAALHDGGIALSHVEENGPGAWRIDGRWAPECGRRDREHREGQPRNGATRADAGERQRRRDGQSDRTGLDRPEGRHVRRKPFTAGEKPGRERTGEAQESFAPGPGRCQETAGERKRKQHPGGDGNGKSVREPPDG
jgi:hypothetical protein